MTYLESLSYFSCSGSSVLNGRSSEKLMLNGGPECAAWLAWSYTLSVCALPPWR
jgi:hypothetical protein